MKEYYWDMQNRSRMGQYLTSIEADFIDQCLQQEPDVHTILDVGGGSGRFAIPLEKKGYRVTVTEVRSLPLWWLKKRSPSTDALLISPEACDWPIKDASMDCILAIELPVIKFHWFWQECYRVLKPGGFVVTCASNRNSYKEALYKTLPFLRPLLSKQGKQRTGSIYNLSAQTVLQLIEENNFQLEQALGFNWLPAGRSSEFWLIPWLATLEQSLGLRRLPFRSPWVLYKARVCKVPMIVPLKIRESYVLEAPTNYWSDWP